MAYVENSNNIFIGESGVGAVGSRNSASTYSASENAATAVNFLQNPSLAGAASLYGKDIPPFRNELNQYASYAPVFTLGCLTNIELNFPISYRVLGPAVKIIRSGGRGGPTIPTIYDIGGKTEFFIEDVQVKNHVAPNPGTRHSNATGISFKVIEPYSMGQFFHSLRTASLVCGHPNYVDAPFLLSIAFIGYDDEGNVKSSFFSQRHFPVRIVEADMSVTESGAVYDIKAVPYNEMAVTDRAASLKTDIRCQGRTVAEVLQTGAESLSNEFNKLSLQQENANQVSNADKVVIMFPNTGNILEQASAFLSNTFNSATSGLNKLQGLFQSAVGNQPDEAMAQFPRYIGENQQIVSTGSFIADRFKLQAEAEINPIGASTINRSGAAESAGESPFQEPLLAENVQDPGSIRRSNVQYDPNIQVFQFDQGTSIPTCIEEVILASDYGRSLTNSSSDATGRLNWFRIETQTYNDGGLFGSLISGQSGKVYVYRVVKYKVDESTVGSPGASFLKSTIIKQAMAAKAYSYIYTGQNDDIIDFDLNFNMTFFTGVPAARAQQNLFTSLGGQFSFIRTDKQTVPATNGAGVAGDAGSTGAAPLRDDVTTTGNVGGGGGAEDTETNTARSLNDMIINTGNDMLKVDLKIHGDPYFLCDSGLGNYVGLPSLGFLPINIDGTMNPIDGEVHVILNFRTPSDYNDDDGYVKYPLGGFLPIAMFSGVYQVITVENEFKKGQFVQTLSLVRKRNQDLTIESVASKLISWLSGGGNRAIGAGGPQNQLDPVPTDQE